MPFTLFHLGPALLIGILGWKYLDLPTLLLGSVIVDIRTALVFFGLIEGSLHGLFHTLAGGTLLAFILIGVITPFRSLIGEKMESKGFKQVYNDSTIVGAAFLSIYLHLILDSILYSDMNPFMPLVENPFLGIASYESVYGFCILSGVVGISLIPWLASKLNSSEK
jgi:hypothetical protein